MPKFSIKDLMVATTLIGVGLGCLMVAIRSGPVDAGAQFNGRLALFYFGSALTGSGVLYPFGREMAMVGFALGVFFAAVLAGPVLVLPL